MMDQPPAIVRPYHQVPLAQVASTSWTHVQTCGTVVYVRRMQDGDWHVTLTQGPAKVVAEIIPALPLLPPRKGQVVRVHGVARYDRRHSWGEIHPVEGWVDVGRCDK